MLRRRSSFAGSPRNGLEEQPSIARTDISCRRIAAARNVGTGHNTLAPQRTALTIPTSSLAIDHRRFLAADEDPLAGSGNRFMTESSDDVC
jgi:hypothetical protein